MNRRFGYCDACLNYKTFQKSIQNKAETIKKINNKTTSFFTSFFAFEPPFRDGFGGHFGLSNASWALLGASWTPFGRTLGALGRLLGVFGPLGRFLGASWAHLGRFGRRF